MKLDLEGFFSASFLIPMTAITSVAVVPTAPGANIKLAQIINVGAADITNPFAPAFVSICKCVGLDVSVRLLTHILRSVFHRDIFQSTAK